MISSHQIICFETTESIWWANVECYICRKIPEVCNHFLPENLYQSTLMAQWILYGNHLSSDDEVHSLSCGMLLCLDHDPNSLYQRMNIPRPLKDPYATKRSLCVIFIRCLHLISQAHLTKSDMTTIYATVRKCFHHNFASRKLQNHQVRTPSNEKFRDTVGWKVFFSCWWLC